MPWVEGEALTPTNLNNQLASAATSTGFSTNTLRPESGTTISFETASLGLGSHVGIVSSDAASSATSIAESFTLVNLRPQRSGSNDTHYAINVLGSGVSIDWKTINDLGGGGLPRAKLYVAYQDSLATYPGITPVIVVVLSANTTTGAAGAGGGVVTDGVVAIAKTTPGADYLTNRSFMNALEPEVFLYGPGIAMYDVRGITTNIVGSLGAEAPTGMVGQIALIAAQPYQNLPASGFGIARAHGMFSEYPALTTTQNTLTGRVDTNGNTVTWVSGNSFSDRGMEAYPIVISGSSYTIGTVSNSTTLSVTPTAGVQSNVTYTFSGSQYALYTTGVVRFEALPAASLHTDPNGSGGVIVDTLGPTTPLVALTIRDAGVRGGDGTFLRKHIVTSASNLLILNSDFTDIITILDDVGNLSIGSGGVAQLSAGVLNVNANTNAASVQTVTNSNAGGSARLTVNVKAPASQANVPVLQVLNSSAATQFAVSLGTVDFNASRIISRNTTNASGTSATLNDGELRVVAVSTTSAELAYRSGVTTYRFIADATAL